MSDEDKIATQVEDEGTEDTTTDADADGQTTDDDKSQGDDVDWKARALKAEAILSRKAAKSEKTKQEETKTNPAENTEFLTRDEGILIAKGYSDEAIAKAKKIAKGADVPLLDALKDPLMTAFLEKEAEEKRKEEAKLGASTGSGATPPKDVPLDDEGHKKFWQEKMGK